MNDSINSFYESMGKNSSMNSNKLLLKNIFLKITNEQLVARKSSKNPRWTVSKKIIKEKPKFNQCQKLSKK